MDQVSQLWAEFCIAINSVEVNPASAIFRLGLSLILGSVVGFERKRKGQIAGVRTFALISLGATLAMLISIYVPQEYMDAKNSDPGRIAAQVITGIGFIARSLTIILPPFLRNGNARRASKRSKAKIKSASPLSIIGEAALSAYLT